MDWNEQEFDSGNDDSDRQPFGLGQMNSQGDSVTVTFEDDGERREDEERDSVYYSFEVTVESSDVDGGLTTSQGEGIEDDADAVLNSGAKTLLSQLQAHAFEVDADAPSIEGETATIESNGQAGVNRRYTVTWE